MNPSVLKALKVPGQIIANPSDLTTARPHGGVSLGLVKGVQWRRRPRYFDVEAEEFGGEAVDKIYMGEDWFLFFGLRSFDRDAVQRCFHNSNLSTITGARTLVSPSTLRSGIGLSAGAIKLIFSPDDPVNHECVYFREAVPFAEPMEIAFSRQDESIMVVGFQGMRGTATPEASFQRGLIEDIVL